jgi:acyl carrier protein
MSISERVIDIFKEKLSIENIAPKMELEYLGINSIDFIKIIVTIETTFEFEFEDGKLLFSEFPNVEKMINYVTFRVTR